MPPVHRSWFPKRIQSQGSLLMNHSASIAAWFWEVPCSPQSRLSRPIQLLVVSPILTAIIPSVATTMSVCFFKRAILHPSSSTWGSPKNVIPNGPFTLTLTGMSLRASKASAFLVYSSIRFSTRVSASSSSSGRCTGVNSLDLSGNVFANISRMFSGS